MSSYKCFESGLHLTSCDNDGYCNYCGCQDSGEWNADLIMDENGVEANLLVGNQESKPLSDEDTQLLINIVHDCVEKDDWAEFDVFMETLAKKYGNQPKEGMTQVYVVMEAGVEYNDEIYYQAGWENLGDTAFLNVEDARANAVARLKNMMKDYQISSFGHGWYGEPIPDDVKDWLAAIDQSEDSATWAQFIEYCELNGKDWSKSVPEFVTIQQMNVPGVVVKPEDAQVLQQLAEVLDEEDEEPF